MVASRRRMTIRSSMLLIAAVAGALALARFPLVWVVLDARRNGPLAAGLRYVWLWTGLTLVASMVRSPAGRLIASGWVLAGSLAIKAFFPQLSLGMTVDLPGYFDLATILAACLLWLSGWVMGRVTADGGREETSTGAP